MEQAFLKLVQEKVGRRLTKVNYVIRPGGSLNLTASRIAEEYRAQSNRTDADQEAAWRPRPRSNSDQEAKAPTTILNLQPRDQVLYKALPSTSGTADLGGAGPAWHGFKAAALR